MSAAVEVTSLRKEFIIWESVSVRRQIEALKSLDLRVDRGEIYGLLGRNGAGKTTLVKILLGIQRADSGEAKLLGESVRNVSARTKIGYLPEDHRFPEYRTASGLLHFYGTLSGMDRDTLNKKVPHWLEVVDLHRDAHRKVRGFSKGMKQRLGLAQALLHDPDLVFLDEPTDGVDPVGRAEIRKVLERLKAEDKTIFLNSHLLGEVERLCDRVGMLEKGELLREGTIQDLTSVGAVYQVHTNNALNEEQRAQLTQAIEGSRTGSVDAPQHPKAGPCFELMLADPQDIDTSVGWLREHGHEIRAVVPSRLQLEDVFLLALKDRSERDTKPPEPATDDAAHAETSEHTEGAA